MKSLVNYIYRRKVTSSILLILVLVFVFYIFEKRYATESNQKFREVMLVAGMVSQSLEEERDVFSSLKDTMSNVKGVGFESETKANDPVAVLELIQPSGRVIGYVISRVSIKKSKFGTGFLATDQGFGQIGLSDHKFPLVEISDEIRKRMALVVDSKRKMIFHNFHNRESVIRLGRINYITSR